MRIVQVVDGYRKGDGVSNVVAVLDEFLRAGYFETLTVSRQLVQGDIGSEAFGEDAVVFYHLAFQVDPLVRHLKCRKVLIFHNITPPELLEGADEEARIRVLAGWHDVAATGEYFDAAITFSEYSKNCLAGMGWDPERLCVLPLMVRFGRLAAQPSGEVLARYADGAANILFTGRVYPNKKQEDAIAAFAAYQRKYRKDARLFLVGGVAGGNYYPSLLAYAKRLGVADDVIFPGHVPLAEYVAYYRMADLYLCMSAHEGFCIPLVEAMYFGIPIVAYHGTAVPDTLGGGGVLVGTRDPGAVAEVMDRVLGDGAYRQEILARQAERLEELRPERLERQYAKALEGILGKLATGHRKFARETEGDTEYRFSLLGGLSGQLDSLMGKKGTCVVCGAGAAGMRLYAQLRGSYGEGRLVLCDSYKAGSREGEFGCDIVSLEEASSRRDAIFIVSAQDRRPAFEIASCLVGNGVAKDRILFYDKMSNRVS